MRPTSASPRKLTSGHYKKNGRDGLITDIGSRLFDHLVGEHEEVMRNSEAECFGGLEMDDEIKLGRLLDRDVGGLRPADLWTNSAARRNRSAKLAPYENRPPATTSSRRVLTSGLVGCPWWAILELAWVRPPLRWWKPLQPRREAAQILGISGIGHRRPVDNLSVTSPDASVTRRVGALSWCPRSSAAVDMG